MTTFLGLALLGCGAKDDPPTATHPSETDADSDADTDADSDADTDADADPTPTGATGSTGSTGDTAVSPIEGRWTGTCGPDGKIFYGFTAFDLNLELAESGGLVSGGGTILAFSGGSSTTQPPIEVRGTWDGTTLDLTHVAFTYGGGTTSTLGVEITGTLTGLGTLDADLIWFPGGTFGGPYVYSCPMDPG